MRRFISYLLYRNIKFQFTHPGKGATTAWALSRRVKKFQFTHPGKGATTFDLLLLNLPNVSIHAPWEGCDLALPSNLH